MKPFLLVIFAGASIHADRGPPGTPFRLFPKVIGEPDRYFNLYSVSWLKLHWYVYPKP